MGRWRWLKPEMLIAAVGLITIALVAIEMSLVQSAFTHALPSNLPTANAVRALLAQDRDALLRFGWVLILLILAMFVGLALMLLRNRRANEELRRELERNIQERTAQLAYERNLLRTLIDHVPDLMFAKDRNSRFLLANQAFANFMGASTPAYLLGKSEFDFFPSAVAQEFRDGDVALMQSNAPLISREELVTSPTGGEGVWFSTTKVPLHDQDGRVIGLVGVSRDVTEMRAKDILLAQREELYRSLVEVMPLCVFRKDHAGRITYGNARYWTAIGLSEPEGLGKTDFDLSPPELAERYHNDDRVVIESGETMDRVEDHRPLYGERQVIRVVKTPVRNSQGVVNGVQGMFWDITEGRQQSEKLREREELLSRILDTVEDGIYIVDQNGKITFANKTMERILGSTQAEIAESNFNNARWQRTTIEGKVFPKEEQPFVRVMATGEPVFDVEQSILRADGTSVIVSINAAPLHDASGNVIGEVASMTDVTARKRAESTLRRQNEYLDALHETTLHLMGRLELKDLLHAIIQRAGALVGTESGYIYLHEPRAEEMEMSIGTGVFAQMVGSTARLGVGATGIVWETGQTLVIDDYQAWKGRLEKPGYAELKSVVTVPLKLGDQVIGVFGLAHTDPERKFDEATIEVLTRFAHLASIALDNARLYQAAQQEIAERKQAEERFHSLFAASPDAILVLDPHQPGWTIVDCNQVTCEMNGYTREELLGKPIGLLNNFAPTPDELDAYLERVRQAGVLRVEAEHRHKDGHLLTIETSTSLLRFGNSELVLGIDRDVTERKRAEQQLSQQKELLQTVFDNIPVMIGMFDSVGQYTLINHEWEQTLGYSLDEMNRGDVMATMYPDPAQRVAARRFQFAPTPGWRDFKTVVLGGRPLDTSWAYTPLSNGMTIAFGQDITQRKEVDRLKNEFISTVSHELRTPLTSIRGSLGLIAGGVAGEIPPRVKSMIDIAHKNSERLVRLINDILDIEKIESGKMTFQLKAVELLPLIEQTVDANRGYGEQYQVGFVITEAPADLKINVDPDRVTQVMTNLLSNAAKFSPPGSRVEISARRMGAQVCVSVRDHGNGIPDEFKGRIFQKFAQADSSDSRQKGGTGLGLSIVKAIVEKHGGTVGFDTTAADGTTFYFKLPQYHETPPVRDAPTSTQPRVLIVEDDRDVAHLLSLMLAQGGFATDIAYDATRALEYLHTRQYAALTLDLMLEDRDGISFIRELRRSETTRDMPIVVVSAIAEQGKEQLNGDAIWVADWLQKPIDQQQLVRAVAHASRRLSHGKPHILHVEDDPDVLHVVESILQDLAEVTPAQDVAGARGLLERERFDLVILDPALPDGDGTELLPLLRHDSTQIPVVIFSARDEAPTLVHQVNAALVKSRTSNEQLLRTITQLISTTNGNGATGNGAAETGAAHGS